MRAIGKAVKSLREVGLEDGPGRDVDVASQKCLERRGAGREEVDLESAELRRSKNEARISRERDAAR